MEDNSRFQGDFALGNASVLARLVGAQDLKEDIRKNIEALGEGYPEFGDDKLMIESSPKKNLVFHMPMRASGETLTVEVTEKRVAKQIGKPGALTMFDIVNDRKSGLPTHSEVLFCHVDRKKQSEE